MPDYKPNYFVRAFAVLALVAALVLVIAVIATSGGGSGASDNGNGGKSDVKVSKAGRRALQKGVWIVHSGDTLGKISLKTGIDEDTLLQLNPDLDPQALLEGQRIALR
jgi:LysM repeat protein